MKASSTMEIPTRVRFGELLNEGTGCRDEWFILFGADGKYVCNALSERLATVLDAFPSNEHATLLAVDEDLYTVYVSWLWVLRQLNRRPGSGIVTLPRNWAAIVVGRGNARCHHHHHLTTARHNFPENVVCNIFDNAINTDLCRKYGSLRIHGEDTTPSG